MIFYKNLLIKDLLYPKQRPHNLLSTLCFDEKLYLMRMYVPILKVLMEIMFMAQVTT